MIPIEGRQRQSQRHHYVPQWIIREFAEGKNAAKRLVNAYDRKEGRLRRVSSKDVFVKKNLNTIPMEAGPDDRLERWDAEWESGISPEAKRLAKAAGAGYFGPDGLRLSGENPARCTIAILMAQARRIMAHDRKGAFAPLRARWLGEGTGQYSPAEEKALRIALVPETRRKLIDILGRLKPAACVTHPNDEFVLVDEPLLCGDAGAFVVVSPRVMLGRVWHGLPDPGNRTERVVQVLRPTAAEVLDVNLAMSRECRTIVSKSPKLGAELAGRLAREPKRAPEKPETALFWRALDSRANHTAYDEEGEPLAPPAK